MTLGQQILWGSGFLGLCLILNVIFLALFTQWVGVILGCVRRLSILVQISAVLLATLAVIVFAITVQVWIWAFVWITYEVLTDWNSAVYFSLVTFTSLGYGDIVLGPQVRVFAAFASVTGLLAFGFNTAYLVALMARLFQDGKLVRVLSQQRRE